MKKLIALGKSEKNKNGLELLIIEQEAIGKPVISNSFEFTQKDIDELARLCNLYKTN